MKLNTQIEMPVFENKTIMWISDGNWQVSEIRRIKKQAIVYSLKFENKLVKLI